LSDILSYSEDGGLALELSAGAAALAVASAGGACALVMDASAGAGSRGPVLVLRGDAPLAGDHELVAQAILAAAKTRGSSVVLIGATKLGRQVAGKLAVMAGMGVLSDVRDLKVEDGKLTGMRGVYAGRFNARLSSPLPCIALVPRGAYQATASGPAPEEELKVSVLPSRVRHLEERPKSKESVDLRTAKIIVAAGRGFKKKEDLALAEGLVEALGGVLGASRPLSSDLGWLGEERHVGLTGIYVRPNLYIAVGISGQLQHVAGMKDSRVIVAINRDKQAPIFQVADYGIVGDLYQVLPALMGVLRS